MLKRAQSEVRRTMEAVSVAQTALPLLLRHRGGWLAWLKRARAAQLGLVCTLAACLWLLPPLVEGFWELLLPEQTQSSGFLGLRKSTVRHAWVEPLTTWVMALLWAGGGVMTFRLLVRELSSTLKSLRQSESLDETCLPETPARNQAPVRDEAADFTPFTPLAAPDSAATRAGSAPSSVVLAKRYALAQMLGAGGMGEVYLADDLVLQRRVALKRLPPQLMENSGLRERFRREARSLARLNHAHVVQLFDFIELPHDQEGAGMWMVMEVVAGGDLQHCLEQGRLNLERALELGAQMAKALQAAHAEGIVHRDFKPANVLLTKDGRAKVTDFGIARLETACDEQPKLTQTGAVMGTPTYMSPEQARGAAASAASDVYSLGATLYEMLTGHPLFEGALAQVLTDHMLTAPASFADRGANEVPAQLESLVMHMLSKDPDERPSLAHVIDCLHSPRGCVPARYTAEA